MEIDTDSLQANHRAYHWQCTLRFSSPRASSRRCSKTEALPGSD